MKKLMVMGIAVVILLAGLAGIFNYRKRYVSEQRLKEVFKYARKDESMMIRGKSKDEEIISAEIEVESKETTRIEEIKDKSGVPGLIKDLKDEDASVRGKAARALGKIKDPRAVEPLIALLKDEVGNVRWGAVGALGKITGKDFGQNSVKWQEWWEQNKGNF